MELGTSIMGLVALAICCAPFIIIRYNRSKYNKTLLSGIESIAANNNVKLGYYEFSVDYAIGLTQDEQAVLFYRKGEDFTIAKMVYIKNFKACLVEAKRRNHDNSGKTQSIVSKVSLVFQPLTKHTDPEYLTMYSEQTDFQLFPDMQFAYKWAGILNEKIK
jgi:hypothetical protein